MINIIFSFYDSQHKDLFKKNWITLFIYFLLKIYLFIL